MAGSDNRDHRDTGTEETREAVLADVRAHCKLLKDAGFDGDAYDIRVLVERLDAAWKRELESVTKRNGLGNAKKWREALEAWVEYWMWGGYDGLREHRLKAQTKAALAAPPRNCDLPLDKRELWEKFMNESRGDWAADWGFPYADWLLEEAKEGNRP